MKKVNVKTKITVKTKPSAKGRTETVTKINEGKTSKKIFIQQAKNKYKKFLKGNRDYV